jgi:hypothetical protein
MAVIVRPAGGAAEAATKQLKRTLQNLELLMQSTFLPNPAEFAGLFSGALCS